MITTDAKCDREIKRKTVIGKKEAFSKRRSFEINSKQNIEDMDDKDTDIECGGEWFGNMDHVPHIGL